MSIRIGKSHLYAPGGQFNTLGAGGSVNNNQQYHYAPTTNNTYDHSQGKRVDNSTNETTYNDSNHYDGSNVNTGAPPPSHFQSPPPVIWHPWIRLIRVRQASFVHIYRTVPTRQSVSESCVDLRLLEIVGHSIGHPACVRFRIGKSHLYAPGGQFNTLGAGGSVNNNQQYSYAPTTNNTYDHSQGKRVDNSTNETTYNDSNHYDGSNVNTGAPPPSHFQSPPPGQAPPMPSASPYGQAPPPQGFGHFPQPPPWIFAQPQRGYPNMPYGPPQPNYYGHPQPQPQWGTQPPMGYAQNPMAGEYPYNPYPYSPQPTATTSMPSSSSGPFHQPPPEANPTAPQSSPADSGAA
ncbi:hypothetical protein BDN72DRAFT_880097 [Pluteus cervinus]|uniref:Uncharacterized protein n=1 Tax=Pluteus cervinus TaxID=181527 RepID=A0ACD3AN36_9AGAR|nr:hypothetical protein BDN72DRAFT_880097 [Pluteus cervinus]